MSQQDSTRAAGQQRVDVGAASLWASAFIIMAMIVVQAGRLGVGNSAQAQVTSDIANLRMLTSKSNVDEELLSVLDQNNETLSAYLVVNSRSLERFDTISLPEVFNQIGGAARR